MKLRLSLPLDEMREKTIAQIDANFLQQMNARSAMAGVYAEKAALAEDVLSGRREPPAFLKIEAASRGMPLADLCQLIIERAAAQKQELLDFEALRQHLKAEARKAASEQQLRSLVSFERS